MDPTGQKADLRVTKHGGGTPRVAAEKELSDAVAASSSYYEYRDEFGDEFLILDEPLDKDNEYRKKLEEDRKHTPEFVKKRRACNEFRHILFRHIKEDGKDYYVQHGRRPNMDLVYTRTQQAIPNILFRVYCSKSAGLNSHGEFRSCAHNASKAQDMVAIDEEIMRDRFMGHLSARKTKFESHFISFTGSWPFAVHKAHRMREKNALHLKDLQKQALKALNSKDTDLVTATKLETDIAEAKESLDVYIAIIARDDLPDDVLLFHAPPLMKAHNLEDQDIGITGYAHHAEYLVWDGLKAPMQTFSLKSLRTPRLPHENMLSTLLLRAMQPFFWRKDDDYIKAQQNYIEAQQKDKEKKLAPPTQFRKPHEVRDKLRPNWEDRDQELENMELVVKGEHYKENVAKACHQGSKSHAACNSVKQGAFGFDHLRRYLTFIQNRFEPKYQLPMLAMMLSLMTDVYHKKDMVAVVGQLRDEVLMTMGGYKYAGTERYDGRVFEIKRGEHMLRDFCAALGLSVKPAGGLQCRRFARTEYGRKTSLVPEVSQLGRKILKRKAPDSATIEPRL